MSYKNINFADDHDISEDNDVMKRAEDINNNYIYCGYHSENYDHYGGDMILHYISKETLGDRDIKTLDPYEYDEEVWPSDKHYKYCKRTLGK